MWDWEDFDLGMSPVKFFGKNFATTIIYSLPLILFGIAGLFLFITIDEKSHKESETLKNEKEILGHDETEFAARHDTSETTVMTIIMLI